MLTMTIVEEWTYIFIFICSTFVHQQSFKKIILNFCTLTIRENASFSKMTRIHVGTSLSLVFIVKKCNYCNVISRFIYYKLTIEVYG
ncbi:hypothetical protein AT59_18060 [Aeromonas hydrophila AD9]|nr:hypothetical protein AT59_18060 [Aeromonas hydrophila AD9]